MITEAKVLTPAMLLMQAYEMFLYAVYWLMFGGSMLEPLFVLFWPNVGCALLIRPTWLLILDVLQGVINMR